jgi:hypothetical protein
VGRSVAYLLRVADQAADEAEALERARIGHRIDTDGRTIDEITDAVTPYVVPAHPERAPRARCPFAGGRTARPR